MPRKREKRETLPVLKELSLKLALKLAPHRGKSVPPLVSLLKMLSSPEGGEEKIPYRVIEKFLLSWREHKGEELKGSAKRELSEVINILRFYLKERGGDDPLILYSLGGTAPPGERYWKLDLRSRPGGESAGDDEAACLLQVETPGLGKVKVRISRGGGGSSCLFVPSDGKTAVLLKKEMGRLGEQLKRRGLGTARLQVKAESSGRAESGNGVREVDLWG